MPDPHIEKAFKSLERTEPGPGAALQPVFEGNPASLRLRSIPHVDSGRLHEHLQRLDHMLSTPEGLMEFDAPRRTLVQMGMTRKAIEHELALRGHLRREHL